MDSRGNNYFVLDFSVSNGSLKEWPHLEKGIDDPMAAKFWLVDMARLERNSTPSTPNCESEDASKEMTERKERPWWARKQRRHWPKYDDNDEEEPDWTKWITPLLGNLAVIPTKLQEINSPEVENSKMLNASALANSPVVGELWSAFFLALTVAVLLSLALLMLVASRLLFRYKNMQDPIEDAEEALITKMPNEKSKFILPHNGLKYT